MSKGSSIVDEKDFWLKEILAASKVRPVVRNLWYRGRLDKSMFVKTAAVVGSRRISRYGKQALGEIVPRMVSAGYSIVSGLMYGVDQEAHRLTLENGGTAIAVLGYGIDYKSEESANKMAERIIESGGVVLSEYPGTTVCQRWMFPQRNRIVVGLSDIVVIAEAGIKSGSMSTAKWARRLNKPIYAVPGSVFSETSAGTNKLISEGIAKALTKEQLDDLTGRHKASEKASLAQVNLAVKEREIVSLLKVSGPQTPNQIARETATPVGEVLAILMSLELEEILTEERGVWIVR